MTASSMVRIARSGSSGVTLETATAMMDALQSNGYFYLQHPLVTPSLLQHIKHSSRRFFNDVYPSLSEYHKESIKAEEGFRGFYRYIGASGRDDAIDCFSIGKDLSSVEEVAKLRSSYYDLAGWESSEYLPKISKLNPWGPLLEANDVFTRQYRADTKEYYEICTALSMDVLRHVACALGVKAADPRGAAFSESVDVDLEYFTRGHSRGDHNLEAKFYPQIGKVARSRPLAPVVGQSDKNKSGPRVLRRKTALASPLSGEPSSQASNDEGAALPPIRLDSHSDLSTVTILAQDALGGLEVFDERKETFIAVPVLEDAVLVNAGTFLERWTGGMIGATPHRVRSAGGDRCSVVFFCFPNHDYLVDPLIQCGDNPALDDGSQSFLAGDLMPPLYSNPISR